MAMILSLLNWLKGKFYFELMFANSLNIETLEVW